MLLGVIAGVDGWKIGTRKRVGCQGRGGVAARRRSSSVQRGAWHLAGQEEGTGNGENAGRVAQGKHGAELEQILGQLQTRKELSHFRVRHPSSGAALAQGQFVFHGAEFGEEFIVRYVQVPIERTQQFQFQSMDTFQRDVADNRVVDCAGRILIVAVVKFGRDELYI